MVRIALRFAVLASFFLSLNPAHADVMFSTGTVSQTDEQQIVFNAGDVGNTINGTVGMLPVTVYSQQDALEVYQHGSNFGIQTDHSPSNNDTSVNDVTIGLAGSTYSDLLGSIYGVFAENPTVDFSVWTTDSSTPWTWSFTGDLTNNGNEDNFFSIYTTNNEEISQVTITGKFFEVRDLDLSGVTTATAPVRAPEPGSMMLLGAGLLGLAGFVRRRI